MAGSRGASNNRAYLRPAPDQPTVKQLYKNILWRKLPNAVAERPCRVPCDPVSSTVTIAQATDSTLFEGWQCQDALDVLVKATTQESLQQILRSRRMPLA